ncbi:hypothetical protein [Leuconostoc falkenbergense]|uniref:hypothetical protein n=1 Tax=Leuconostoc falkenbergense TaxID=2766470 RepID=UPI00293CE372|nr:hypothetical protein [Leuconostoc falkenbergense]MDV3545943.1 hypothetical protein [Leuconostoc falkenbergense]
MTEPVAYLQLDIHGKEMVHIEKDMNGYETKPLYTADQFHKHVKMTSKLRDKFIDMKMKYATFYSFSKEIYEKGNPFYSITEHDLMRAWLNPEETIEIMPTVKWFVRSKQPYQPDIVQGLPESGYLYLTDGGGYSIEYCEMTTFKDDATKFDTKEEAELWTNPLTEAVQLPEEGE